MHQEIASREIVLQLKTTQGLNHNGNCGPIKKIVPKTACGQLGRTKISRDISTRCAIPVNRRNSCPAQEKVETDDLQDQRESIASHSDHERGKTA
jgi:hypothetical protein